MSVSCDNNPIDNVSYNKPKRKQSQEECNSETSQPFSEVPLQIDQKRNPKRTLHFSDGILEEYSTDEELDAATNAKSLETINTTLADPKTMTWSVYLWYLTLRLGTKTLSVCDYLGENLAHFFGITTPKYQYEIDEYQRMIQEEDDLQRQDEENSVGWVSTKTGTVTTEQSLPTSLSLNLSPPVVQTQFAPSSTPLQKF